MYKDNRSKFVAVVNQQQPLGLLMNALAHTVAGLLSQQRVHLDQMEFLSYRESEGVIDACVSRFPFIILKAKNGNQIRTLRQAAGVPCNVFVDTMLGASADEQLHKTRSAKERELDYVALCLFGPAADIDKLTRKFSLFNGERN
jgi:hypothetical protein